MSVKTARPLKILVLDIGGTHIKFAASDHEDLCKYPSGPQMTAAEMVDRLLKLTRDWRYDVVSIGYPGVVRGGAPAREPHNLGAGWVGFDFAAAFRRPVRILNDAAMQALGDYAGGKMLFLGLGTGLGSALVVDGIAVPMELGHLPRCKGRNYESYLGNQGRKRLGNKKWRAEVLQVANDFRNALLPDEIVLGGGNAHRLKQLPPHTRLGEELAAIRGGLCLWETPGRKSEGVGSAPSPRSAVARKPRRPRRRTV